MIDEEKVSLDCPYCGESIYQRLDWFKKPYATCPYCHGGLAAGQFAPAVEAIEQALDTRIEEMMKGVGPSGCGGGGGGCCKRPPGDKPMR